MGSTGVASKPPDEISTLLSTCSADVASSLVVVSLNGGTAWAYGNEVTILVVHVVAFMMGASVVSRLAQPLPHAHHRTYTVGETRKRQMRQSDCEGLKAKHGGQ